MATGSTPDRVHLDAPIVDIVVYPAGARVTRRGRVRLTPGTARDAAAREVVLDGLPWELEPDSVRVAGRGPARLLGVDVEAQSRPEPADEPGIDLTDRRAALSRELSAVIDEDDTERARRGFLDVAARTGAAALARTWSDRPPAAGTDAAPARPGDQLSAAAEALAAQMSAVAARRRELAERRAEIERRIAALDRTIANRRRQRDPDTRAVVVDLELTGPGPSTAGPPTGEASALEAADAPSTGGADVEVELVEVELEVSYLVVTAGWESGYDARLDGERVTLTWFARVTQRTGEDWPATALVLSTARPARRARLPELDPHYVDVRRPPLPPPAAAMPRMMAGGMPPAGDTARGAAPTATLMAAAAPMPVAEAAAPDVDVTGTATYRPARRVAVPADGAPHRTTVTVIELDAALDYLIVPKISPDAYLRATVTNGSSHTLRPGKVSIFHGADFVGAGAIGIVPPGAEVELQLGVDDRVRVERELIRRSTGRRVVGNVRRTEVGYRIELANHTPRLVRATVRDQVPVSRHESVIIRDVQAHPAPAERTELGLLTWQVELAPGAESRIEFSFRLEHPKGLELTGWRD